MIDNLPILALSVDKCRSKRARATQSLSAITAALQYEDSMEGMADYSKSDRDSSIKGQ
jgi:hypothetical protein